MEKKIEVMISSRCSDKIICKDGEELSFTDLRMYLKKKLESEKLLGNEYFQVMINEEDMKGNMDGDALEKSLEAIRDADFVLILYNGSAGWKVKGIGVCRAEFEEAFNNFPAKTSMVDFLRMKDKSGLKYFEGKDEKDEDVFIEYDRMIREKDNSEFKAYKDKTNLVTVQPPEPADLSAEEYKEAVYNVSRELLFNGFLRVFKKHSVNKVRYTAGEAYEWTRMNYERREKAIREVITSSLNELNELNDYIYDLSIIPDAMSVAEARAMGGRPFLDNYTLIKEENEGKGVINFMGVFKNATESQMRALIGHPDITIVKGEFGFYVWDMINQIQLITLITCRDSAATKKQVTRFYNWVDENREWGNILNRATKRYRILKAVKENQGG